MSNIINSNAVSKAESIIDGIGGTTTVKRVKKDRGLMERSTNEKIIIEEDNRRVIFG